MAGHHPSLSAQLAADRHARFAAEAAGARVRRLLRRPHPAPRCAGLAGQLPAVGVDLRPPLAGARRPARRLKAANALRLLDERPEITHVDTWNARSNAHKSPSTKRWASR